MRKERKPQTTRLVKAECGCRTIRLSRSSFAQGDIKCLACSQFFYAETSDIFTEEEIEMMGGKAQ